MVKSGSCKYTNITKSPQVTADYTKDKKLYSVKIYPQNKQNKTNGMKGAYIIHIAVALNKVQTVKKIFQVNQLVPGFGMYMSQIFSSTFRFKTSYIETAVKNERANLLELFLLKHRHRLENDVLLSACEEAVSMDNSHICELFLKTFQSMYHFGTKKKLIEVLRMVLDHKAYTCLEVLAEYLKRTLKGKHLHLDDYSENIAKALYRDPVVLTCLIKYKVEPKYRWLDRAVMAGTMYICTILHLCTDDSQKLDQLRCKH